jgi:hypothetical protein
MAWTTHPEVGASLERLVPLPSSPWPMCPYPGPDLTQVLDTRYKCNVCLASPLQSYLTSPPAKSQSDPKRVGTYQSRMVYRSRNACVNQGTHRPKRRTSETFRWGHIVRDEIPLHRFKYPAFQRITFLFCRGINSPGSESAQSFTLLTLWACTTETQTIDILYGLTISRYRTFKAVRFEPRKCMTGRPVSYCEEGSGNLSVEVGKGVLQQALSHPSDKKETQCCFKIDI